MPGLPRDLQHGDKTPPAPEEKKNDVTKKKTISIFFFLYLQARTRDQRFPPSSKATRAELQLPGVSRHLVLVQDKPQEPPEVQQIIKLKGKLNKSVFLL